MAEGIVKWFKDDKGYGFITPEAGGEDIFVHYSNVDMKGRKTLSEGQRVTYRVGQGKKGPAAESVRVVG